MKESVAIRQRIISIYREQLTKFKKLSVCDDDGNFLFGGYTEFNTKVTQQLIDITQKRLTELLKKNINSWGIQPIENYTNGQADKEV